MNGGRVVGCDFGGDVGRNYPKNGVSARGKNGLEGRQMPLQRQIARLEQELQLALRTVCLLHQVHVLAAVAQHLLPTGVEVDDPVHGQLARREGAVPAQT